MFKNLNPAALGIAGHQSEIIELALSNGFQGIDADMVEFAARVRLKGMAYARRLLDSAKLRIGTFPLPFDLDADDNIFQSELKKLPEYAKNAAELGCTRTTAMVSPADDKLPYHENFEFHRRRLHEICGVLEPSGVRLAVGFRAAESLRSNKAFQFIHDLDALSLLVNMVSAPNVGLLVDIWEVVAAGATVDAVRKLAAEDFVAVSVADMPVDAPAAGLDDKSRVLPGSENGRIDAAAFLTVLREMGYDGPVTPMPSRTTFQTRRRELIVKQTAEALDKAWRAAGLPSAMRPVPAAHD